MKEIQELKSWTVAYEKVKAAYEDLQVMLELYL